MSDERKVSRYGWRRDLPDPRDRIFNLEEPVQQGHQLPLAASLRQEMPPVYDQGQLGSCTANATAALLEYQQVKQNQTPVTPSRLFVYYEERRLAGYPLDQDTGAEIRDGIKVLATDGAPPETDWRYDIARFAEKPPAKAYADAIKHEALAYKRIVIGPGAPMRSAVAGRLPIAFGFTVPDYFEDPAWDATNVPLPLPDSSTRFIGGHAVTAVGYDYGLQRFPRPVFEVRNSWGSSWGDGGYFWIDARWFDPFRQLADDLWVVSKVT